MSEDFTYISVLEPFECVFKQSDVANSERKYKRFRICDIKVGKKQGIKLLKRFDERSFTRQERDLRGAELRELVQRIATKTVDDCFVALVRKELDKKSELLEMTIYFLEDGVKLGKTPRAVQGGEEEGAVGGAVEEHNIATLVLPHDWRKSFQKSLEKNIHLCHGHIGPAMEALRLGHNSYTDSEGKTCNFNGGTGDRELVQGRKIFQSKLRYKLHGMNPHGKSTLCKVHLNGDGSDCYLVYVDRKYMEMGRVFLLVGVFTHSECGIKTGARKKEHGTQRGGSANIPDATLDMEAAEKYLQ
ncbi:PREDICTED: uncharacterized protein LOC109477716 [Branchiostoma belcheri]|uniref:Uncharacterized protein LOC109477716 n=1 Tax=Branchiostoma belcheri TaxID=7741 RepID=A0A6P4ZYE9_BRABE|nr:PREDICTED: uncharacterized protein LOC109477716 [Branchiostoma belcheri]